MTQSLFINFNTNMVIRCKTQKNSSKDLMLVHQNDNKTYEYHDKINCRKL